MSNARLGRGMGRKPSDIEAAQKYGNQDGIWKAIRALKSTFTKADISCWLVKHGYIVNDVTVYSYLARLSKGGYLVEKKQTQQGACKLVQYTLQKDVGCEAPRVRRDGALSKRGLGNEQMWRSMKMLSSFDYNELLIASSTEEINVGVETVRSYIRCLHAAGYLMVTKANAGGHSQRRYKLIKSKNSGPLAPQIQKTKRVYDPNLERVIWNEEEENVACH